MRAHIVHAIVSLLQHPPVQGKTALGKLKDELLQPSFPSTQVGVSEFLDQRYLNHIKTALLDNIISVLLKVVVKQTEPALIGREERVVMCLVAIQRRHGLRFDNRVRQELPRLADGSNDVELKRVMRLFRADRRCWTWLDRASQIRITELVKGYVYSDADIHEVAGCLEIDELSPLFAELRERFQKANERSSIVNALGPSSLRMPFPCLPGRRASAVQKISVRNVHTSIRKYLHPGKYP